MRVKTSSEMGPKCIYAQEHKLYYYCYYVGGHWENKNWKTWQQNFLKNISFTKAVKRKTNTVMGSRFFSGCFHRAIIWFSLFIGLFQRAKIYLTRKMRHNARQSDNNVFYMLVVYLD